MREILNAILYVIRSGCAWRLIPHDLPNWRTVYGYFRAFRISGVWTRLHDTLREQVRRACGRKPTPSAAVIDSQSVKTTEKGGPRGYDAGKKINGRKRHIVVDTLGLIIAIVVHEANIQDRDGAKLVLEKIKNGFGRLKLIWADGAYAGKLVEWTRLYIHRKLEIVKRSDDVKGFVVLPRRWVVERTFGWLRRYRRLSKDYEQLTENSEAVIQIAMINLMSKRLDQN
jgi:putative transposase